MSERRCKVKAVFRSVDVSNTGVVSLRDFSNVLLAASLSPAVVFHLLLESGAGFVRYSKALDYLQLEQLSENALSAPNAGPEICDLQKMETETDAQQRGPPGQIAAKQTIEAEHLTGKSPGSMQDHDVVSAEHLPSQAELISKLGRVLLERGTRFRKTQRAYLRPAIEGEAVETILDGKVETTNKAKKGDWIVRANTSSKEMYILSPEKFFHAYDVDSSFVITDAHDAEELTAQGFKSYAPKMRIIAMKVTAQDLLLYFPCGRFMASWGQPMLIEEADYICGALISEELASGLKEVYRIERSAFQETYALA
eukprot:TRINITY_DN24592_c0_g2_i1.p1 TRINITY_DN24592_c0_g2~~TRINITY_DN24592_c0_g2_i1.p1  ORF type:complete len:311 (+),score=59.05 TRINITY_DN24592_c0_g2_i1:50-982(+)